METKADYDINQDTILQDLVRRARGGIFIYPLVWVITATWAGISNENPAFFYLNTAMFGLLMLLRGGLDLLVMRAFVKNSQLLSRLLVTLIMISCLHWGLLSAWIIYIGNYPQLHYPYMIIIAAFTTGGTTTLSIARPLRIFYPFLMFGPSVLLAIYTGGPENYVLATLAIFTTFYILDASRVSSRDYWRAVHQQRLAKKRAIKLKELSVTDPLTKLRNRSFFNTEFELEWKRCNRLQVPISIVVLDLDHFKKINDTYGHGCGDRCLELVGKTLGKELLRETDIVARYGGEEFAIVLPGTHLEGAKTVADRVIKEIRRLVFVYEHQQIPVFCSIGVATSVPESPHTTPLSLFEAADQALYQAKNEGRNRWCAAEGSF